MKNKVLGAIGIFWGGGIVVRWLLMGSGGGSSAYQAGQSTAVLFGALMLAVGTYYFFKDS